MRHRHDELRYYRAHRAVHDQVGGTVTAAGELPLRASLLVSLRVGDGGNPWRPRSAEDPDRVTLPYRDPGEQSVLWDDPMRGLLRREEDLAAGCGCIVP